MVRRSAVTKHPLGSCYAREVCCSTQALLHSVACSEGKGTSAPEVSEALSGGSNGSERRGAARLHRLARVPVS